MDPNAQPQTGQNITPIYAAKNKSAEATLKDGFDLTPYAVMLTVQWQRGDLVPVHALTFVLAAGATHAQEAQNAVNLAGHIFETMFRPAGSQYPDVVGEQTWCKLDMQDFNSYLASALRQHQARGAEKCPFYCKGDVHMPMWWFAPAVKIDDFENLKGRLIWTPESPEGPNRGDQDLLIV